MPSIVQVPSAFHGGEDVPIFASGPWSFLFTGVVEQTYIYYVMEKALGQVSPVVNYSAATEVTVNHRNQSGMVQPSNCPEQQELTHMDRLVIVIGIVQAIIIIILVLKLQNYAEKIRNLKADFKDPTELKTAV